MAILLSLMASESGIYSICINQVASQAKFHEFDVLGALEKRISHWLSSLHPSIVTSYTYEAETKLLKIENA